MSHVVPIGGSKLGNFLHFQRDPLDFLRSARDKGDVVALSSGAVPAFIVNSPAFIREILVTQDNSFRKGRSSAILGRTAGDGVLTSEGTLHEHQRRMMQPAFLKQKLAEYAETVVTCTEELIQTWEDGAKRSLSGDLMDLTLRIISRTMFGLELGDKAERIAKAIDDSIVVSAKQLMSPVMWPTWLPTRSHLMHKGALRTLDEAVYLLIEEAKHRTHTEPHGLLDMLLRARGADGQPLKDRETRDQIITILIAGHETTANALSWMWYLLAEHPQAEAIFAKELQEVLGDRAPTFADIPRLTYTQQIFQEALRLYPPAWMLLREAKEEVELLGQVFPKNSSFLICPFTVQRNPAYFERPDEFVPERFSGEGLKDLPRFAYFPFGGGSRACIGMHFAQMEAILVLATIGQRYRLHMAPNHHAIKPEPLVSLRVQHGLHMCTVRR